MSTEGEWAPEKWWRREVRRFEIAVTCNWFAIAFHCWRKGHDWRTTRPSRCVELTHCAWCGHLRGSRLIGDGHCRWYRPAAEPASEVTP